MSLILPTTAIATAAELQAINLALQQAIVRIVNLETSRTVDEAAFKALAAELNLAEGTIAKLVAAITPVPVILPPYDPQILWRTGMETMDLSAWTEQVNTPDGLHAGSAAVSIAAEGILPRVSKLFPGLPSLWVMKQWCSPSGGSAGTRMARYPEIDTLARAGTPFYYSWWDFFPSAISIGSGGWFNLWQVASNKWVPDPSLPGGGKNVPVPLWVMGIDNGMTLNFVSDPTVGTSNTYRSTLALSVGQWNFIEVYIDPASDTTGALKVWLNGQVALDIIGVQTQFPPDLQTLLTWVTNNCYGMNIAPVPFVHYVDDVTVSLRRMP